MKTAKQWGQTSECDQRGLRKNDEDIAMQKKDACQVTWGLSYHV